MARVVIDGRFIGNTSGRYLTELLTALEEIDVLNEYIVLVPSKDLGYWTPSKPNFSLTAADIKEFTLREQFAMLRVLRRLKPDLVHFAMPQQPVLYRGRRITTIHDLTLLRTPGLKGRARSYFKRAVGTWVFKLVGRLSQLVLVPSNYTRTDYLQFSGIPADRVRVTYEGSFDTPTRATPVKTLIDKQFLLYVGTHTSYKNVRRLVEAHQLLLGEHPGLHLVFVGRLEGVQGALISETRKWVEECGFANVEFTGFISDEELAWSYQHAAAYVFPSLMEGFGLPGLEAMAHGAPVVSSSATCLPEIYSDAAMYFDPLNINEMRNQIAAVISDGNLADSLRKRGRERASQFSWRRMAEQTLDAYIEVLEG